MTIYDLADINGNFSSLLTVISVAYKVISFSFLLIILYFLLD